MTPFFNPFIYWVFKLLSNLIPKLSFIKRSPLYILMREQKLFTLELFQCRSINHIRDCKESFKLFEVINDTEFFNLGMALFKGNFFLEWICGLERSFKIFEERKASLVKVLYYLSLVKYLEFLCYFHCICLIIYICFLFLHLY